jgi:O-antigen/teichoic acid export membrane protein
MKRYARYETEKIYLMNNGSFSVSSVVKSSGFSIVASVVTYVTFFMLARTLDQGTFANYLYVVAWGMIAAQVVSCARDQCLLHFSKAVSREPLELWGRMIGLQMILLAVFVVFGLGLSAFTEVRFPLEFLMFVVPAFYLGPIYETQQRNVEYAAVTLAERLFFLISAAVIVAFGWQAKALFLAYCFISGASLTYQLFRLPVRHVAIGSAGYWHRYILSYATIHLALLTQLFYGNISRLIIESKLGIIAFGTATLALQIINLLAIIQNQVDKHIRPNLIIAVMDLQCETILIYVRNYFIFYLVPLGISAYCLNLWAEPLISLFFGTHWEGAAGPLRILSPLLVTVGCLRLIDIFTVALELGKSNLAVNILVAVLLTLSLIVLPNNHSLASYLGAIVLAQIIHVTTMGFIVFLALKKRGFGTGSR